MPRGRMHGVSRTEAEKVWEMFRRIDPEWKPPEWKPVLSNAIRLGSDFGVAPCPKQQVCELCGDKTLETCRRKGIMTCTFCHKKVNGGCKGVIEHRLNNKICLRKQLEAHEYHRKQLIEEDDEGWFLARADFGLTDSTCATLFC